MLTAKLDGSYRKAITGTKVFRFVVSGSESEIEAYKSAQEDNFRTDEDGKPLFFSTRYLSDNIKLIITENNNVVVDKFQSTQSKCTRTSCRTEEIENP